MSNNEQELRAEFLKKNSPLNDNKSGVSFEAPPIMPVSKSKKASIFTEEIKQADKRDKIRFWQNWNTNHYAGVSVALGVMLIIAVVWSYTGYGSLGSSPGLNATLSIGNDAEEVTEVDPNLESTSLEEVVIEEDVVNGTSLVDELVEEKTPQITDVEEFNGFLDSYGL